VSTKANADQVSLAVAEFTESVRHSPQLFRLERGCDEIDQKHQHNNQAQSPTAGGLKNAYSRTTNLMDDGINRRAAERAEHTLSAAYGVL
jgi:hypothetical protein